MPPESGDILLPIARAAIQRTWGLQAQAPEDAGWLADLGATFVTLRMHGELRGCMGSLAAHRPLLLDVKSNAVAAAFRDPRFSPLSRVEFADIRIEVSLLSRLTPLDVEGEADALARLRPNEDGVVLEYGPHRGTFLPQVWENLPEPSSFLRQLKRKAGLPETFWSEGIRLSRYTVLKWSETEAAPQLH
jgi:AmmeMemoRadiSam system protein A